MALTAIQWTGTPLPDGTVLPGFTLNPWLGCTEDTEPDGSQSPECDACYAREGQNHRVSKAKGLPLWGPEAYRQVTTEYYWRQPLKWNREAAASGIRRKVFCASQADVFEDFHGLLTGDTRGRNDLTLDDVRAALWAIIQQTPHLDWLLLTKRPQNVARMVPAAWLVPQGCPACDKAGVIEDPPGQHHRCGARVTGWPAHVWLGFTGGTQRGFDRRWDAARKISAPVIFASIEPQLEPVVVPDDFLARGQGAWCITGGESERRKGQARPYDLAWPRALVRQCQPAQVPCFVKQTGAFPVLDEQEWRNATLTRLLSASNDRRAPAGTVALKMSDSHGGDPAEWPVDLRIRQWPQTRQTGAEPQGATT